MKKNFFCVAALFFSAASFAANKTELKKSIKPLAIYGESVCETRSSTVTNAGTGESITVSCTKCADTGEVAAITATACAYYGAQRVAALIAG